VLVAVTVVARRVMVRREVGSRPPETAEVQSPAAAALGRRVVAVPTVAASLDELQARSRALHGRLS